MYYNGKELLRLVEDKIDKKSSGDNFSSGNSYISNEYDRKDIDNLYDANSVDEKINIIEGRVSYEENGKCYKLFVEYAPDYNVLVRCDPYPYDHNIDCHIPFRMFPKTHQFYGRSLPDIMRGVQNAIDIHINQMIDAGTIANVPMFWYKDDLDLSNQQFGPGFGIAVNEKDDIGPFVLNPATSDFLAKIQFLEGYIQKASGVNDYTLGRESNIIQNKTATGITSLLSEANQRFEMTIQLAQGGNEIEWNQIIGLMQQFMTQDISFKITGYDNPIRA